MGLTVNGKLDRHGLFSGKKDLSCLDHGCDEVLERKANLRARFSMNLSGSGIPSPQFSRVGNTRLAGKTFLLGERNLKIIFLNSMIKVVSGFITGAIWQTCERKNVLITFTLAVNGRSRVTKKFLNIFILSILLVQFVWSSTSLLSKVIPRWVILSVLRKPTSDTIFE